MNRDEEKNRANSEKHNIDFKEAQRAFFDPLRIIAHYELHSKEEPRWFCVGKVNDRVLTVRFTQRDGNIRIIGAGEWRKWRNFYEQKNKRRLH